MTRLAISLIAGLSLALVPAMASARPGGGGGGGAKMSRGGGGGGGAPRGGGGASKSRGSPSSINHSGGRPGGGANNNRPGGNNNRPGNNNNRPGGNNNININNSTNVNVSGNNRNNGYRGGGGCCYNDHYDVWDAVGTAAAVTATVAITSAVIGSMTTTRPPDCVQTVYSNVTYLQCGSSWYQPNMVGSSVQYVVVGRPY